MTNALSEALEIGVCSDPGCVRADNEDAVFADPALGLVMLADGMGGHNAGEVASGMAMTILAAGLAADLAPRRGRPAAGPTSVAECVRARIAQANAAIHQAAESEPRCAGMGTTLVLAIFHDDCVTVAHVGDSRLYRLRGDAFGAITRDHSLVQEQVDRGLLSAQDARHSRHRNLVTRALGIEPEVEPDVAEYPVEVGDLYLLCSDGLNDMLEDEAIAATLRRHGGDPDLAARALVLSANERGGRDNVSVILVRVRRAFPAPAPVWKRFLPWRA